VTAHSRIKNEDDKKKIGGIGWELKLPFVLLLLEVH
jgi:hypothetical protein